jgi:glutathione S-transferase
MPPPALHLIIGNYNTSSWSLRAWLALRLSGLAFLETRIPLRLASTPGRIAEYSPSKKLPVLLAEGVPIWDSLAIAEFMAELAPDLWPHDPLARAEARAVCAEMHSGFADLRRLMPMDVVSRFAPPGRLPRGLAADVQRIKAIWQSCRSRFAGEGPFLFGGFSLADAMMAPVATRFVTHGVPLDGLVEDYVDSVMSWPDMVTWRDAASAEQTERAQAGELAVRQVSRDGRAAGSPSIAEPHHPALAGDNDAADDGTDGGGAVVPPATMPERSPQSTLPEGISALPPATEVPATPKAGQPMAPTTAPPGIATAPPREAVEPAVITAAPPELAPLPKSAAAATAEPSAPRVDAAEAEAARARDEQPRKRLFQGAPPAPVMPQPAIPDRLPEPPIDRPAAALPQPPLGPSPGAARLGWIRRSLTPEPLPEAPTTASLQLPLRRPAADFDPAVKPKAPEATDPDGSPEPKGSETAASRAAEEAAESSNRPGSPPPRIGTQPASTAIKPIGGGILRRR